MQQITHPWVIRLPGVNPGSWISSINAAFGWIFSPVFVGLSILVLIILIDFLIVRMNAITLVTNDRVEFFSRENLPLFALVVITTKILHELGHAVAAFRRGCECHEMGILLLAGLPSLYCDVSDAWTLPNRWHRISISLAGIWGELLIAAVATLGWMASVPGIVHAVCFDVMVVCSMGTLLFNANPLVRYDGYYVLMDLTGVSNLGRRSQEALERIGMRWILGAPDLDPFDAPQVPRWCVVYGIAAAVYRVFLTCAILWALHLLLKPYSLSFLVWTAAIVGLIIWGVQMGKSGISAIRVATASGVSWWRVGAGVGFLGVALLLILATPIPWYVLGDAVLEPADQQTIVASIPGRLVDRKDSGTVVTTGEVVAKLDNREILVDIARMDSEVKFLQQHLAALYLRRNDDPRAAEQIPRAQASLDDHRSRLNHLLEEKQRLQISASESAVVYPAPFRTEQFDRDELSHWTGTALDPVNRDAWIAAGDAVCQIGNADQLEAVAIVAQDDLEAVAVGQRADVLLKSSGVTVQGEITRISFLHVDTTTENVAALTLPRTNDFGGRSKIRGNWYEVRIRCLSSVPAGTKIRARGKARIHIGSRTVGSWIGTQFFKTFRWNA